jgi:hypothetical protein
MMADPFADIPVKSQSTDPFADIPNKKSTAELIPTGGTPTVPLKGELAGEPKFLEKAAMAASAVPFGGLAAGGLKAASAGTRFAPYAGQLAEALIPKTLGALTKATGAAGAIGAGAEGARSLAEKKGASPATQELVEMGTGLGLGGLGYGASKIPGAVKTLTGKPFRESVSGLQTSAQQLAESLASQERASGREMYGKQRQARLGAAGERESTEKQIPALKQQFGTPQEPSVTGRNLMNDIKQRSDVGHQQRKDLAETTYSDAYASARQKQAQKDFWQTSPSGRNFFDTLEKKITVSDVTPVSSTEEKEIRSIINELQGKVVGEKKGFAFDPKTGFMSTPSEPEFAPLDIKGVVEQLRKLREAANGFPEEGYKSISQKRAKAMVKSLEESIAGWDDKLRQADRTYKQMSERLYPEQTRRGETVLAKQRYDINELAADPINAPKQFFQSKQGVDDLTKLLGGDKDKVAEYANQYVINELSTKKTAKEVESWVTNRKNIDWMSEIPGLRQRAESYAKSLKTLEEKGASAGELEKTMKGAGRRTAQEMSNRINQLKSEANVFETIDPNKVIGEAQKFVNKLQAEGVATPAQIEKVQKQILEAEKLYKGKERAKKIAYILGTAVGAGFVGRETTRLVQGG